MSLHLKSVLILFIVLGFSNDYCAQSSDTIIGYIGLELKINLSNYTSDCEVLSLIGSWTRTRHNPCEARLQFEDLGEQRASIYIGDSLVHQWNAVVKALPDIRLVIGKKPDGSEMTSQYFKIQPGPYLRTDAEGLSSELLLVSFNTELIRNKRSLFKRLSIRGRYTSEITQLLKQVRDGDKIIFSDVYAQIADLEPFQIEDISIKIDDD